MKKTFLLMIASLLLMAGSQDLRVLVMTPTPKMHCESCENKIKKNLRFEKGVVKIETSVEAQTVTVTYNPAKTNVENIQAAMKKIGYDTKIVSDQPKEEKQKKKAK
ncbi:MAG: heavy-metal-associated domain-containing protein [Bacteroidales bacterium]|nr:heavy-metal-associated domain-containing protein [Bacteroidales bacterium]